MNLLLTMPTFRKWGGAQEVVVMLADHFRALGDRVIIASEDTPETLRQRFAPEDVHYALPLKQRTPWAMAQNLIGMVRIVRRERIDLISSHEKKTSILCMPVGRLLGVPVVHTGHTQTTNWRARWFGFFGQHVTAVCNSTKEYLVRRFGIPPERITVIHATSRLVPPPQLADIESVRGQFGLHPRQPVIVCVARLSPEKGHAVLLRAMLTVRREFPDARLLLVGKGHIQQQLEELTASLGLSDCVTFAGYRKQPGAIVAAASVAVLPSLHSEGFPLINIECLRLGIPVVSSNTDGVPELIRDGETGLLVPPGNAAALADAICRLLRDPAFATRLAQTGRAVALARFDPTLMCQQYEAYFASVLGQPPRPEVAARLEQLTANSA